MVVVVPCSNELWDLLGKVAFPLFQQPNSNILWREIEPLGLDLLALCISPPRLNSVAKSSRSKQYPPLNLIPFRRNSVSALIAFAIMATIQDTNGAAQQSVYPRSHVGFDSITSQIERKLLKRGFQFNVICVGEF